MAEKSVVAIYETVDAAEAAVKKLIEQGFPAQRVSVIARDLGSGTEKVHGFAITGDVAKSGAGIGAWVGGIFGLLVGAGFFWLPAVGPVLVAGSLTSLFLGGLAAGAAEGGLLGALIGLGMSHNHVAKYEEKLKEGKCLVVAHGSAEEVAKAKDVLKATSPEELEEHKGA
ncbi:general stress protein [Desulfothermobacter acidiphilus]|uniref:general stress protein n=1 Tax=Desulfothermobacter acidiphilus TaxID=1938353 RepID=UPI003F8CCC22